MNLMMKIKMSCVATLLAVGTAHAQGAMPQDALDWMNALKTVDVVEFDDADMQRMLKTARAFESAGLDEIIENDSPTDALEAIKGNAEAMRILKANGYTAEVFSTHIMNLAMSMGAAEMQNNKAEMDAAIAQLDAMKGQIPDEQFQFLMQQVVGVAKIFDRAPAGNIALATKYQDQFEAIGED